MTEPLVVTQRVAAPPDVVYTYLTESAKWAKWQGADAAIEPRPGGIFVMTMPDGAVATGQFLELVPDRKVVFTWGWSGHPNLPAGSSRVAIELLSDDGGTLITLTHSELPADEMETHTRGWNWYLPRLAAAAQGDLVEPDRGPGP